MTRATLDTGSNGIQLQLEYGSFVDGGDGGTIDANSTTAKLSNLEAWIDANGYPFFDSSNTLTASGGWVDDNSWSNISMDTSGSIKIKELVPQVRSIIFGSSEGSYNVDLQIVGINSAGTMSGAKSFAAPRRPYHAPPIPAVTITGAGVATIPANQTNTAADYYVATSDWRWETNDVFADHSMAQANTVVTKTGAIVADGKHRMAVRLVNGDAASSYGYSGYVYGVPATPTGLTATRQAVKTTVRVAWASPAKYAPAFLVERSLNGGAFVSMGTIGALSYTDTSVPLASTASYRIRAQSEVGINTAVSAYTTTVNVPIGYAAPDAPTSVGFIWTSDTTGNATVSGNQSDSNADKYWEFIDWELYNTLDVMIGSGTKAGSTTSFAVPGLAAAGRYRVRMKSRNAIGLSAWVWSPYLYTTPGAPANFTAARVTASSPQVLLSWTAAAGSVAYYLIEQASSAAGPWEQIDTTTSLNYTATLSPTEAAYYRVTARTPAPTMSGAATAPVLVSVGLKTNKSLIPGVQRIYNGIEKVILAFVGDVRVWVDAENIVDIDGGGTTVGAPTETYDGGVPSSVSTSDLDGGSP